jgi:hypothetical protein
MYSSTRCVWLESTFSVVPAMTCRGLYLPSSSKLLMYPLVITLYLWLTGHSVGLGVRNWIVYPFLIETTQHPFSFTFLKQKSPKSLQWEVWFKLHWKSMETWRSLLHSTRAACQEDELLIEFIVEVDKTVTTKLSTVTVYFNAGPIDRRIVYT